jgi:hypothetical protein
MDNVLLTFRPLFTVLNTSRDIKQVPHKSSRDSKINLVVRLRTWESKSRGSIPGKDKPQDRYQGLIYPGLKRPGCEAEQ